MSLYLCKFIMCFYVFISSEVMVKVHVVDLKSETIAAPVSVRAYLNQTITEFKQLIAQVCFPDTCTTSTLLCSFYRSNSA